MTTLRIPLDAPVRKWSFLAIAVVLLTAYLILATRQFVAARLAGETDLASLEKAVRLDPGNAEAWDHLGQYYMRVAHDPSSAIAHYKTAVSIYPHTARYWLDLANAYEVVGDASGQLFAIERAIESDPRTPDAAWEAANLYMARGENNRALHEFSVVMANDPTLVSNSLEMCWAINPDTDAMLRGVVPHEANAYLAFLGLLESKGEIEGSFKAWSALMDTNQPFEKSRANEYFSFLTQHQEVEKAQIVWRQTASRFGLMSYLPTSSNLIVNSTFSLALLNAGLDWQFQKQSSVNLSLERSSLDANGRQLLIVFNGTGISDAGIYQLVPVEPNTVYNFSAYYKNNEFEGAGGPHVTVQDAYSHTVYYESDELKNAFETWKVVAGDLTTAADTKLLIVHVRRLPEGRPVRGKLWLTDFHLVKKAAAPDPHG